MTTIYLHFTYQVFFSFSKEWYKWKHRNYKRNWFVARSFPDKEIWNAYHKPNVHKDIDRINWKIQMNKESLIQICLERFGMELGRIKEILDPIDERLKQAVMFLSYFFCLNQCSHITQKKSFVL